MIQYLLNNGYKIRSIERTGKGDGSTVLIAIESPNGNSANGQGASLTAAVISALVLMVSKSESLFAALESTNERMQRKIDRLTQVDPPVEETYEIEEIEL